MAVLLRASLLSDDERTLIGRLERKRRDAGRDLELFDRYYDGEQRLRHIGIAVPDELQEFQVVVNMPRVAVRETVRRQKLRAFQRAGSRQSIDPVLRQAWEANNLDSQSRLCHTNARVYGRAVVSVNANEEDPEQPLITVEDTQQFAFSVNNARRRITAAWQMWREEFDPTRRGALYLPDSTIWLTSTRDGWVVDDRDDHRLGRVPLVLFLNQQRTARWSGRSEMADVMGKTDAIARLLTNMQVAAETHAVPSRWVAGVSKGDFVDRDGKPLPVWEAYFTALMATANKDAKFGQFTASDLKNFHDSVNNMLAWCAAELGLPTRYAGQQSVNPAAEGAIRADESRLIANVEDMNAFDGDSWCWVMGLHERIRTREWLPNNSVRALWHDPATPTMAERGDYLTKMYSQGLMSREGVWDDMGWDEPRKDRERGYLALEASDPLIDRIVREVRVDAAGIGAGAVPAAAAFDGSGGRGGA